MASTRVIYGLACAMVVLLAVADGFGTNCGSRGLQLQGHLPNNDMPANLKIAFFGDQGLGSSPAKVLKMIKEFGAEAVIHLGDFDYEDDPASFQKLVDQELGAHYPYFASIGNHDVPKWTEYSKRLLGRFNVSQYCDGEFGVNSVCNYKGLLFVLSGVGTLGTGHVDFIDNAFTKYASAWKVCAWHKNQQKMQIGGKKDEVGWDAYEMCREHGAIIATAHEHSYGRTYLMSDVKNQVIAGKELVLSPGKTFVFCQGLGGKSLRSADKTLVKNPWWAAVASSTNGANYAPLLCTFNINGDLSKAHCELKDINGKIWDKFDMVSNVHASKPTVSKLACKNPFLERQIAASEDDLSLVDTNTVHTAQRTMFFAASQDSGKIMLRFRNITLPAGAVVRSAFLQMFGAHQPVVESLPSTTIKAMHATSFDSKRLGALPTTISTVAWGSEEDADAAEEWEAGSVWVSPDLSPLVHEITHSGAWSSGSDLAFVLEGTHGAGIYSYDESPCMAPSLVIELESKC
eukprot:Colp12_sorted_trinity150504_noHs@12868